MDRKSGDMDSIYEEPERIAIIPKREGTCPECAVWHDPKMPHLLGSMYYQVHFRQKHGRFPTWADAMAHCAKPMQHEILAWLKEKGVPEEDIGEEAQSGK